MINTLTFNTGRVYGGNQQFLDIWFEQPRSVELNLEDVDVYFRDNARNIAGKVKIFGFEMDSSRNICKAVLCEYDAGRYTLI